MGLQRNETTRDSESQTNGIANTNKCGGIFPGEKWLENKISEAMDKLTIRFQEQIGSLQNEITGMKSNIAQIEKDKNTLNDLQQVSDAAIEQLQSKFESFEETYHQPTREQKEDKEERKKQKHELSVLHNLAKTLNTKVNALEGKLNDTLRTNSEEIERIHDAVSTMLEEVPQTSSIESRFTSIEDSLEKVSVIPSIESRLHLLENSESCTINESQSSSPEASTIDISNELADRQWRSRNLVLHNVPESNSLEEDIEVVKHIIEEVAGKDVEIRSDLITGQPQVYRMGRRVLGKSRSMKIHLGTEEICQDLLKHSRKLTHSDNFSNVVLQADLTAQQRSHLKRMVCEKKLRNRIALKNQDEADWVIRSGKLCRKRDIYFE